MDEVLRWLNFILAVTGLAWLGIRSAYRWPVYSNPVRLFLLTLSFYVFGVAFGAVEAALQDAAPLGFRVGMYLLGNIALLVTLAITQESREVEVRTARGLQ